MRAWKNGFRAVREALGWADADGAQAGTAVFDYEVELFDEENWLVAIGRMTLAFTPDEESIGQASIDGGHCFDRRGTRAPRLPLGAEVAGLASEQEMRMTLMGFLDESLSIEAHFIDSERKYWEGLWFEPAGSLFPTGNVRAFAVAGPQPEPSLPVPRKA